MPWTAVTTVVVNQLYTVKCAHWIAGLGETLIDVSFTSWSHISWPALTFVAINSIKASSTMMAGTFKAFIDIVFTQNAYCSMTARASKFVNEIMAGASIVTWIRVTVIDIVFTVEPLESFWAVTFVLAY